MPDFQIRISVVQGNTSKRKILEAMEIRIKCLKLTTRSSLIEANGLWLAVNFVLAYASVVHFAML